MNKILYSRINTLLAVLLLSACATDGIAKRTTEAEGPVEARARNKLAAKNPAGLVRVGEGFERSGNMQSALNLYGQAMVADSTLVEAQLAYARVLIRLGGEERGIAMLTALLADNPGNHKVRAELSNAYIRRGDFKAAEVFMRSILDNPETSADHLLLGGMIAEVSGDGERARALFGRALDKAVGNPEVLKAMALSFALEGEYASAVALIQKAMDRPSGLISGKIALASVYALSGQLDAAMRLARDSMELGKANERLVFYQLLPRLTRQERAIAVMFDQVPKDALQRLTGNAAN